MASVTVNSGTAALSSSHSLPALRIRRKRTDAAAPAEVMVSVKRSRIEVVPAPVDEPDLRHLFKFGQTVADTGTVHYWNGRG